MTHSDDVIITATDKCQIKISPNINYFTPYLGLFRQI